LSSTDYVIPDVSAELVMDVSKILANSAASMTETQVAECFAKKYTLFYVRSALVVSNQLGISTASSIGAYVISERLRSDIKRASREELYVPFQACLKNYAPFLLFVDFVSKGYSSSDSAARTRGILNIKANLKIVENSLRRWGIYSKLIELEKKTGKLGLKLSIDRLSVEYVARLLKAFEAELKAKVFIIDMLGPEVFAYLDRKQISLDELTAALLEYESDTKAAASRATQTFELFLWRLAEDAGIDPKTLRGAGTIEIADALRAQKCLLGKHLHLCHCLGSIRNMTHHDPDKETGKIWDMSKQGALLSTLFVPAVIRSLYLFSKEKKQEL
jgi:hypothetical protein